MKQVLKYLNNNKNHQEYLDHLQGDIHLLNASNNGKILAVANAFYHTKKDILVVCNNLYHAQKTYDTLSYILTEEMTSFYPQDEFITSEMLAMSDEFKLERINTIKNIIQKNRRVIVTHTQGLCRLQLPKKYWEKAILEIKIEEEYQIKTLLSQFIELGYKRVYTIEKQGEFSLRGGILDIYPLNTLHPYRIEFFDEEVESIRVFDLNTQRSVERSNKLEIFPMHEFFYKEEEKEMIVNKIHHQKKQEAFNQDAIDRINEEITAIENHNDLDKLNRYVSYLESNLWTIQDFLQEECIFYFDYKRTIDAFDSILYDLKKWYDSSNTYSLMDFQFVRDIEHIQSSCNVFFEDITTKKYDYQFQFYSRENTNYQSNFQLFIKDLKEYEGNKTVLISVDNKKGRQHIIDLLEEKVKFVLINDKNDIFENKINIIINQQAIGFELINASFLSFVENDLYRKQYIKKAKYKSVYKDSKRISNVNELKKGDYIVHYDYGIGLYLGLETKELKGIKNDYIVLSYRGNDKLYLPVENISLIQKYAGNEGIKPRLNRLGGPEWAKTKQRVRNKVKDIADKLIDLYAKREQAQGFVYDKDNEMQFDFEGDFPYEETVDQVKAIEDIKQDMESSMPMDRLLCGDVGYGKTEVALRAAFKAITNGKQVAYLAPTTVLTRQHYLTFKSRLEKYGVNVALLNRFVTPKNQKKILHDLNVGVIDCVVGTHRILSKDMKFHDLGMLIIDEEQRFGVEHKERIKEMKVNVDVLSLTATPIPRTLQMAIMGVKSMSLLESPPKNRYPVQTYVLERNESVIKDAIERELSRGGQVFYLYNKVEDIDIIAAKLQRLIPESHVVYAHGKIGRVALETVMSDFQDKKYDVLVSTTIIETGIDIPNANTLIIHDADKLGLSQLYQIRGRVGRSDKIAYAYLMYDEKKILKEEAQKRLQVIKEFTELGSGFKIAVRDLSIRGAGDVLGNEQSGFIDSVGVDLYMKILEDEVKKQQGIKTDEEKPSTIKLNVSKHISEEYIDDDYVKLEMHQKINDITSILAIDDLMLEFKDRFGKVDPTIILYMYEKLFEYYSTLYEIERKVETKNNVTLFLSKKSTESMNGEKLFLEAEKISNYIRFAYESKKIQIIIDTIKLEKHWIYYICELFDKLTIQ